MNINKETIKENFNEDIEDIKKGRSTTTYYIENQGKLKLRNETTPNNVNTAKRVMEIATGHGNRVYENPLQFAIAVNGFEGCLEHFYYSIKIITYQQFFKKYFHCENRTIPLILGLL